MVEPAGQDGVQYRLPRVAERGMPEVVPKRDRLGQVFVEPKRFRNGSSYLAHLKRMREPCAVVVAFRGQEHLGLVLQAAERFAVDYAVAVVLIRRADDPLGFRNRPAMAHRRSCRAGMQDLFFYFFRLLAYVHKFKALIYSAILTFAKALALYIFIFEKSDNSKVEETKEMFMGYGNQAITFIKTGNKTGV